MNKLFTLFLAAAAMQASAAVPELVFRGTPVSNNAELSTGYTVTEEVDDYGPYWIYTQDAHLSVRGESSRQVTVTVTSTNQKMAQYCGIDGQCILLSNSNNWTYTKSGLLSSASGVVTDGSISTAPLEIDRISESFEQGKVPQMDEIKVSVTASYNDSPSESITCYVTLATDADSEHNGINDVAVDNTDISYVRGNVFSYNVDKPTKLAVYSTSGALVMSRTINATGTLNLDSLHPGVYIYTAGSKSGKILVTK